jgi:topoisomerase-4 subunit A
VSSDKTIDALYAFTNCEVSMSPNCCVIDENKPHFLTVSDVLRKSVDNTKDLLRRELEIERGEILEQLHFASLEKIFIEERIYKDREFEEAPTMDAACEHIDDRLTPYYPQMIREVTKDDILRLMEIKMARILKFNKEKAEEAIARMKEDIARIDKDLSNMVAVTIRWFRMLKDKYGAQYPRRTEIKNFDTIVATKVVEANQKLYINRADGFIGMELKKDEYVCNCSDLDDIILFYKDGKFKVVKVADKLFVGQNVLYLNVFKKNDKRTIYNVVYRDGRNGAYFIKRFAATGLTRDKEYDLTQGKAGSKIMYFSANPNGEAEVIKITLKPNPKLKKPVFDKDFSEMLIKGRQSMGNLLTRNEVLRIGLKAHGSSTLGGRKVWFDKDILRLDFDGHGDFLGEFNSGDQLLVINSNGEYYTTPVDPNCHFDPDLLRLEKYNQNKVWTVVLFDASQKGFLYLKRFNLDPTSKRINILGDEKGSRLVLLTDTPYPRLLVTLGGADSFREPLEVDAEQFVGVKGVKARGRRVTAYAVQDVEEMVPLRQPEPEPVDVQENMDPDNPDDLSQTDDENIETVDDGQLSLF